MTLYAEFHSLFTDFQLSNFTAFSVNFHNTITSCTKAQNNKILYIFFYFQTAMPLLAGIPLNVPQDNTPKLTLLFGDIDHLTHGSLGPSESASQAAS